MWLPRSWGLWIRSLRCATACSAVLGKGQSLRGSPLPPGSISRPTTSYHHDAFDDRHSCPSMCSSNAPKPADCSSMSSTAFAVSAADHPLPGRKAQRQRNQPYAPHLHSQEHFHPVYRCSPEQHRLGSGLSMRRFYLTLILPLARWKACRCSFRGLGF